VIKQNGSALHKSLKIGLFHLR